MNDVNDTMSSKKAELVDQVLTVISLAEIGEKAAFPEHKTNSETFAVLLKVIQEKLEALIVSIEKGAQS